MISSGRKFYDGQLEEVWNLDTVYSCRRWGGGDLGLKCLSSKSPSFLTTTVSPYSTTFKNLEVVSFPRQGRCPSKDMGQVPVSVPPFR